MITVNIDPVIFTIGPLSVRWYGLMYVVGITAGFLIARPYARFKGISDPLFEKILYWTVPLGLVGARLYYVVQQPLDQYLAQPWRILAFWEGGMAFYGTIFTVVITLIILSRKLKFSLLKILDIGALFAVVGQFFGRIGNIINGDVIGYPTNLPWGFIYANPNSFAPRHDIAYQPAAVYEALSNIVLFGILWSLRKKVQDGVLFFIYILGYSFFQFVLFFWRDNVVIVWGLKQAQLTAIGTAVAAVIVFFIIRQWQKNKRPETD